VSVIDARPSRRLQLFIRARLGTHLGQPEVTQRSVADVRIHFDRPPLLDADGELHELSSTELRIRVVPGAIRVGIA
jgi:diacylglycerol kinase family enzyme